MLANDIDAVVGARIRRRRRELGLTQTEMGARAGIAYRQIHKYETGENSIPSHRLPSIAKALETTVGRLFEGLER